MTIVMIAVKDLTRSLGFYRDTLGMKFTNQIEDELAFFDAGGTQLCLSALLWHRVEKVQGTELVFAVDHVRATYEWLRAKEITFIREPFNVSGTSWVANFTDPDGHLLSVFGSE